MRMRRVVCLLAVMAGLVAARPATAQVIGTFRWQLLPYCNVVSLAVFETFPALSLTHMKTRLTPSFPGNLNVFGLATVQPLTSGWGGKLSELR